MANVLDIDPEQDEALAQLLELGMAAAREVQARLLTAEDAKAVGDLSLAFNRVSRSVRQTIALRAKLGRERRRRERDEAVRAREADERGVARRKSQVRAAIERVIWTEAEDDEAERLVDDLGERVSEEALYDGFLAEPVAAQIERISTDLGLAWSEAARGRAAPERDAAAGAAGVEGWRSSA